MFITTLLIIISLLCIASLDLVKTEKLIVNDSVEETQAYYVADAAIDKVLVLLKENSGVLDKFTLNKTYGRLELNSLKNHLTTLNLQTVEKLLELYNRPYVSLEIPQENGTTRAGTIYSVAITKTATDSQGYTLRLEATGKYGLATRTLVVYVKIFSMLKDLNGVVVQKPPCFTNSSQFASNLTILNGGEFSPKGRFTQSIYINGDCTLQEDTSILAQAPLLTKGNLTILSEAQVEGEVQATGVVSLNEGVLGEPTVKEQILLNYSFPEFPIIEGTSLEKNCDYYYRGDQIFRAEDLKSGIHYVDGNVTINGNYQGNITLGASGSVTIPHSAMLKGQDPQVDSLLLIGFGGVRIDDQAQVLALVYTPADVDVGYQAQFSGILVCRDLESNGASFAEASVLIHNHPTWHTTEIKIISWQERYPVFRIN